MNRHQHDEWDTLYREVYPSLVQYLVRRVRDVERAQDLAQEVFVRALRTQPAQPRAWLFTAASNLAIDESRTVVRRKRHLTLLKSELDHTPSPDPSTAVEKAEDVRLVEEGLQGLSERERQVLFLWSNGCSYREIGEIAGLSVGSVGTTIVRAKRRFLSVIESHVEGRGAS